MQRCKGCKLLYYCGRDCHMKDWKSFHKYGECSLFHKLSSLPDPELESLMRLVYTPLFLRLHLLLKAKPELMNKKYPMHDKTERSLAEVPDDAPDHVHEVRRHHKKMFTRTLAAPQAVDQIYYSENKPALRSLFNKIRNSFLIIDRNEYGLGLYVPITGLKLSCRPNASYVLKEKKLEVRAIRDIAGGEDVTIDLVHIMKPKADRQDELAALKGILCHCDRCRDGDEDDEVAGHAANEVYRKLLCRPGGVMPPPRDVFNGFMDLKEFKEKYQGPYHPAFVRCMYSAVVAAYAMPDKSVIDKQISDSLVERLTEAIPLSFGPDDEVVNMQRLLIVIGLSDWSDLLPSDEV